MKKKSIRYDYSLLRPDHPKDFDISRRVVESSIAIDNSLTVCYRIARRRRRSVRRYRKGILFDAIVYRVSTLEFDAE